jgi:exodeoxyribonuclease-1
MLITKTDLDQLSQEQSFYEFMDKVQMKLASWSPAIYIGYNNINFDEKFLRCSFYQSLHAP